MAVPAVVFLLSPTVRPTWRHTLPLLARFPVFLLADTSDARSKLAVLHLKPHIHFLCPVETGKKSRDVFLAGRSLASVSWQSWVGFSVHCWPYSTYMGSRTSSPSFHAFSLPLLSFSLSSLSTHHRRVVIPPN
ncbi:hypothetical protein F5Y10DRAFT_116028 [Nemania abortiva]|nr:hypothetical protein F5Y10DRAFT_116028 [Nemania abortiva]